MHSGVRRALTGVLAAALLATSPACRAAGGGGRAATSTSPPSPTPTETPRRSTRVVINTTGPTERKVTQAIRLLKGAGIWDRLVTKRLYVIEIQARLGSGEIPEDGHLADANLSAFIDDEGAGGHCFILFYPAAVRRALVDWNGAAAGGYARWDPPGERTYWAAILAHELAHCQRDQPGEKFAYRWTGKAFAALGRPDLVPYARSVYRYVKEQDYRD